MFLQLSDTDLQSRPQVDWKTAVSVFQFIPYQQHQWCFFAWGPCLTPSLPKGLYSRIRFLITIVSKRSLASQRCSFGDTCSAWEYTKGASSSGMSHDIKIIQRKCSFRDVKWQPYGSEGVKQKKVKVQQNKYFTKSERTEINTQYYENSNAQQITACRKWLG